MDGRTLASLDFHVLKKTMLTQYVPEAYKAKLRRWAGGGEGAGRSKQCHHTLHNDMTCVAQCTMT
jgi:hypothetical protein